MYLMTRGTHSFGKRRCWSTVMLNGPKDCLGESRFWGLVLAEDNTGQSLFFRVIKDQRHAQCRAGLGQGAGHTLKNVHTTNHQSPNNQGMAGQKMTTWKMSLGYRICDLTWALQGNRGESYFEQLTVAISQQQRLLSIHPKIHGWCALWGAHPTYAFWGAVGAWNWQLRPRDRSIDAAHRPRKSRPLYTHFRIDPAP